MKAFVAISLALLLAALAAPAVGQENDLRSFVDRVYIHGVPYEQASRFAPETAVPALLAMLADPAEEQHWPNIVVTLGMIGDERAVEPLLDFLQQDVEAPLSHDHYIAKSSVVMALGYVINKSGSRRALSFLIESTDPEVWNHRQMRWTSPYHRTEAERDRQLTTMSLLGLGLSGDPTAADVLRSLQGTTTLRAQMPDAEATIRTALEAHESITKLGLDGYYREAFGRHERQN